MKRNISIVRAVGMMAVFSVASMAARGAPAKRGPASPTPARTPFVVQTPEEADPFMGDYQGIWTPDGGETLRAEAQVIAAGAGGYEANINIIEPGEADDSADIELVGETQGGEVPLTGKYAEVSVTGLIKDGILIAEAEGPKSGGKLEAKRILRHSPTEGQKPPQGATVLLPFKKDTPPPLDEWTNPAWTALPDGSMLVGKKNNLTRREFGDCKLHLEFCVPYMPEARGQRRGNSGIYLLDRYEVQVLDSYGLEPKENDCGAIYGVGAPSDNACYPPLSWQTYDITFRAARLSDSGEVKQLPTITVVQNGVTIQKEKTIPQATRSAGSAEHGAKGPLMLQDHGCPVRYRNIWVVEE